MGTATGRPRRGVTWVPTQTAAGWGTGARTRAWGVALHLWEAPSSTPVKISAPTSPPTLRRATALRSPATWVTHLRVAGLATIASTPFNLGTTALAYATTCATGRLKNLATWVWTPMDAGWATGART